MVIFYDSISELNKYPNKKITFMIDGYGNTKKGYYIPKISIKIGDVNFTTWAFALAGMDYLTGKSVYGIVGSTFISRFDWNISYKEKYVSFQKKITPKELKDYCEIKVFCKRENKFSFGWFTPIELEDNGFKTNQLIEIDFGYTGTIILQNELLFKTPDLLRISVSRTGAGRKIDDTTHIIFPQKLTFSNSIEIKNFTVNIEQGYRNSALIGVSFFAIFDEIIWLNSKNKILLSQNYHIPNRNKEKYIYGNIEGKEVLVGKFIKPDEENPYKVMESLKQDNPDAEERIAFPDLEIKFLDKK